MDEKRFKELESRATNVLLALDISPPDAAVVHDRNRFQSLIPRLVKRLREKGESIVVADHRTVFRTLDRLEELLDEATRFANTHYRR